MPYKMIDLCAGIGGIRRGFELTGRFRNVLSAEIDKYACATYEHLFGQNPHNDLTSEDFKRVVEQTDYEVLLAGFPCQTFSSVGEKAGFDDQEKGVIYSHISDIISRTRPRVVFLENVDNLVRHNHGETFRYIINDLETQLNYKIVGVARDNQGKLVYDGRDFIRNSKHFGVPQNRPRTYIIAFDRVLYGKSTEALPAATPSGNDLHIYESLNDLLEYGAPAQFYLARGYLDTLTKHKERQRLNGNGYGYKIVNRPDTESPVASTIMATGGSGKERNLVIDQQPGIAGLPYPGKKTPLNDSCVRFMTPREWGKLQGFINYGFIENGEERFKFPSSISLSQQYKQLGNSVTIPVIETMANFILECLRILMDVEPQE